MISFVQKTSFDIATKDLNRLIKVGFKKALKADKTKLEIDHLFKMSNNATVLVSTSHML